MSSVLIRKQVVSMGDSVVVLLEKQVVRTGEGENRVKNTSKNQCLFCHIF
jgi:hypothetical protein